MKINKYEWRLIGAVTIFFWALIGVLIWYGYAQTPDNAVFINFQYINSGDTAVYYSWIEQVIDGHVLHWNLYTPEEHPRFLFDIFWVAVGGMAKLLGLSAIAAYNVARFLLVPVLATVLYFVVAYFFEGIARRRWVYLFLIFSSGFGGYAMIAQDAGVHLFSGLPPMDTWVPEAFTFMNLYHSPHFMFSYALLLGTLLLFLLGVDRKSYKYTIVASLTGLLLFQFHPYHAPTIFAILIAYGIVLIVQQSKIPWDYVKRGFVLGLSTLPAIAYHYWTLQEFFIRQQHAAQNITSTTGLLGTLISYGVIGIFGLIGLVYIIVKQKRSQKEVFLATWLIVHAVLIYIPVNYQRRLTEGLQVVLVLVACIGLIYLKEFLKEQGYWKFPLNKPGTLVVGFILFLGFTNGWIIWRDVQYIQDRGPYLSNEKMEAFQWIHENTPEQSVIFATYQNGNTQPAFGVRQSYLGHWGMTAEYERKSTNVYAFFSNRAETSALLDFLRMQQIDYLFFGPEEYQIGEMDPYELELPEVFSNDSISIFKVTGPGEME